MTHPSLTELKTAVKNNDVEKFLALVDRWDPALIEPWKSYDGKYASGAFLDPENEKYLWTPQRRVEFDDVLETSMQYKHPDTHKIVRKLIELGAHPDASLDWGTGVANASLIGDLHSMTVYLEAGADVNGRNPDYPSACIPLKQAVLNANVACAALLLRHGADINITDDDGEGVMHWATCFPDINMVSLLIAAGAKVEGAGVIFRYERLIHDDVPIEVFDLLYAAGADTDPDDDKFYREYVQQNSVTDGYRRYTP